MKKIAIKKEQAFSYTGVPLVDNYHFSIMPKAIENDFECQFYKQIGYEVVEVSDVQFDRLVKGFGEMISFQLEVNMLFNELENLEKKVEGP